MEALRTTSDACLEALNFDIVAENLCYSRTYLVKAQSLRPTDQGQIEYLESQKGNITTRGAWVTCINF